MSKNNICPIIARNYHSRWSRFCSLPNEVKEGIVELLIAASEFGIESLMAKERLNRLQDTKLQKKGDAILNPQRDIPELF
jgi:hypothetical protein